MLNWLRNLFATGVTTLITGLRDLIETGLHGIGGVIDTVFGQVTGGWTRFARASTLNQLSMGNLLTGLYHQLHQLITHDIPAWARTAWWWVANPDKLALMLFWFLVRLLEDNAWAVAGHLGTFAVALIARNPRRVALIVETIVKEIF
jgi:hypothetical protein